MSLEALKKDLKWFKLKEDNKKRQIK